MQKYLKSLEMCLTLKFDAIDMLEQTIFKPDNQSMPHSP